MGVAETKGSARYAKRVERFGEDQYFVGSCREVIGPCRHGTDEVAVHRELCGVEDKWLQVIRDENRTLPEPGAI